MCSSDVVFPRWTAIFGFPSAHPKRWQGSGTFGTCCRSRRRCSTKRRKSVLRPIHPQCYPYTHSMILDALHRIADCRESLSREEARSEERRVGKECRARWSPYDYKRKREKE